MGKENVDPAVLAAIDRQDALGGINTNKLSVGTKATVKTNNSTYAIEFLGEGRCNVQGGKYFPEPTEVIFPGSNFGGSMLKIGWIGYKMHMEFFHKGRTIVTSPVRGAKIAGPDWEYEMEWPE